MPGQSISNGKVWESTETGLAQEEGAGPGSWEMPANRPRSWGAFQSALHEYLTSVLVNTLIINRKMRGPGQGPDRETGSSGFCQLVTGTCPQLSLILLNS